MLHNVGYRAWRLGTEQYFVYPNNPFGTVLLVLRAVLQQEDWLSEMIVKIGGKHDPGSGW